MTADEPSPEESKYLTEMGMTEVEPGRWVSAPEAGSPDMQEFLDNMSPAEREQQDLLMRDGRVQNEVRMQQPGEATTVSVQPVPDEIGAAPGDAQLAVYAAIREDSVGILESLDPVAVNDMLDETMNRYPQLLPPDGIAAALRQMGIKCRTVDLNPYVDRRALPPEVPGFRVALFEFPSGSHRWVRT